MVNKEKSNFELDSYRIPQEAVYFDSKNTIYDKKQKVLEALTKASKKRNISLKISSSRNFFKSNENIWINDFSVLISESGISSENLVDGRSHIAKKRARWI